MPRSKAHAAHRAAHLAAEGRVEGEGDDAGRTPARVDYVRREIRRRLGLTRAGANAIGEAEKDVQGDVE